MNYFADRKYLRQIFGVFICLLVISGAVFSQEVEMKIKPQPEKTQAADQEEKADAAIQNNNQKNEFLVTKFGQKEKSTTENFFGNRFRESSEKPPNNLVNKNFAANRFSNFAAENDRKRTDYTFSGDLRKPKQSISESSNEPVAETKAVQTDDQKSLKFGGHAGFVVPIYGYGNGSYSRFYDDFTFGFPVGLTLKPKGPVAIDFEFIFLSAASPNNRRFVLVVHPGVIYGFKKKYAVGVRAAYEANNNDAYGFTPLVSRSFKITDKLNHFIEFDFPVRWNKRTVRVGNQNFNDRFLSGAFALHYGVSF